MNVETMADFDDEAAHRRRKAQHEEELRPPLNSHHPDERERSRSCGQSILWDLFMLLMPSSRRFPNVSLKNTRPDTAVHKDDGRQPGRDESLDFIKGIAIILVVVIHASSPFAAPLYGKIPVDQWEIFNFANTISHVSVPMFVMVIGAIQMHRNVTDPWAFIKKYVPRAAVPLFAWSLIYSVLDGNFTSFSNYLFTVLAGKPKYSLWFLYTLSGLYIAIPFIAVFFSAASFAVRILLLSLWLICEAIQLLTPLAHGYMNGLAFATLPIANTYVGYIILGGLLVEKKVAAKSWHGGAYIIGGMGLAILTTWFASTGDMDSYARLTDYASPFIIILSGYCFLCMRRLWNAFPTSLATKFIVLLGQLSMGVYLIHLLLLEFIIQRIANPLMYGGPAVALAPICAATILGCIPIVLVGRRLPGGQWLFGG